MPVFAGEEDSDSASFLFVPGGQFHAGHRKQISRIRMGALFHKDLLYFMLKVGLLGSSKESQPTQNRGRK